MNLIEQLGGYECAAYEYKNTLLADDFPYVIKATGTKFTRPELGDELLEYRRQHNIFEVGDKVVWINSIAPNDPRIFEVEASLGEKPDTWSLRHATDREIKAGKRLEVNDGN